MRNVLHALPDPEITALVQSLRTRSHGGRPAVPETPPRPGFAADELQANAASDNVSLVSPVQPERSTRRWWRGRRGVAAALVFASTITIVPAARRRLESAPPIEPAPTIRSASPVHSGSPVQ